MRADRIAVGGEESARPRAGPVWRRGSREAGRSDEAKLSMLTRRSSAARAHFLAQQPQALQRRPDLCVASL